MSVQYLCSAFNKFLIKNNKNREIDAKELGKLKTLVRSHVEMISNSAEAELKNSLIEIAKRVISTDKTLSEELFSLAGKIVLSVTKKRALAQLYDNQIPSDNSPQGKKTKYNKNKKLKLIDDQIQSNADEKQIIQTIHNTYSTPTQITCPSRKIISKNKRLKFLGTMAGDQVYRKKNGQSTYCRKYTAFLGSDELRNKIFEATKNSSDGEEIKTVGEHYSFTPFHLRDGRNFGMRQSYYPGGGFFLTLKKLSEADKGMSSLEYITRILGPQLESISGLTVEELLKQFCAYGQSYLLYYFFESIDFPQDGDLVIYPGTEHTRTNYGIFRESEPNWNSPGGGTVESKWEWSSSPCNISSYVFQHDIFFVPPIYGNVAKFYRLKSDKVDVDTLAIKPHPADQNVCSNSLISNSTYNIQDDGSLTFNKTKKNIGRRKIVDEYSRDILSSELPEIQHLSYIKFPDRCYEYAFGKILSTYRTCDDLSSCGHEILEKYFTITTAPQKGDLVVYYLGDLEEHWGIYLGDDMVESKWGSGAVYRHPLFDAPSMYGNTIKIFRLNDNLTVDSLIASQRETKIKKFPGKIL